MTSLTYTERLLDEGRFWEGFATGFRATCPRAALKCARESLAGFREGFGYARASADMLTRPESQTKLGKSERYSLGLMLVPSDGIPSDMLTKAGLRSRVNLCPRASAGCRAACLSQSGHGQFAATQYARAVRTLFLLAHPFHAGVLIGRELRRALEREGAGRVALRLNVTSDIRWELLSGADDIVPDIIASGVRFYDYTAWNRQAREHAHTLGWHITYSAKEPAATPDDYLVDILSSGGTVAMPIRVGKGEPMPEWIPLGMGTFRVIDGDLSDDRTEDPQGVIVGLRPKGEAGKRDTSGFVRDLILT